MKKIVCVVISIVILCSSFFICYATPSENNIIKWLGSSSGELLFDIKNNCKNYGLLESDFKNLFLGLPIPIYRITDNVVAEDISISIYPVINGNDIIATVIMAKNQLNNSYFQFNTDIATIINENLLTNGAIIVDDNSSFLFDGNNYYLIAQDRDKKENDDVFNIVNSNNICISDLYTKFCPVQMPVQSSKSVNLSKYLNVPVVHQDEGSTQCWAASIASIRSYYGTFTTIDDVYDFAGVTKYVSQNDAQAGAVLQNYGFSVTNYWNGSFTWNAYKSMIYFDETPFWAATNLSDIAHAIVLRGFTEYSNSSYIGSIGYMDPLSYSYGGSQVVNDGDFEYVRLSNLQSYRILNFKQVGNW